MSDQLIMVILNTVIHSNPLVNLSNSKYQDESPYASTSKKATWLIVIAYGLFAYEQNCYIYLHSKY